MEQVENPIISQRHPIADPQEKPLKVIGECRSCGMLLHYEDEPLDMDDYFLYV